VKWGAGWGATQHLKRTI